jgi:subtilase family serine protease
MRQTNTWSKICASFPVWVLAVGSFVFTAPSLWGQRDQLPGYVHDSERTTLRGSVHPLAKPEFDLGPVDPNLQLKTIVLGLRKTPQQQAELDQLLKDLQDLNSPLYHRWLTPEQFADRFGVSQNDIDKIEVWLELSGFKVRNIARGRGMILFSGSAGDVERALRVPVHRFKVKGKEHYAVAGAPSIPVEMAPLVTGIHGLDDFRPPHRPRSRPIATLAEFAANPQVVNAQGVNVLVPDDLAAIYDLASLAKAGMNGKGQSIAIAGSSDIDMTDIEVFRQGLNLPSNDPKRVLVAGADNPGQVDGMDEADLDLEWSGAMAPMATLEYVFCEDSIVSAFYAIDAAVAPVLSTSFGTCEWHMVPDDFDLFSNYSQQGAAEGITWVSSAGDSGAAGCEDHNGPWTFATTRMAVLMPSTLPEVTAVGGTEFNEGKGSYWASKPDANGGTASTYIPEMAWNDESIILQNLQGGIFSTAGDGFASGGGGASIYFDKPLWQTGPGVPDDESRDVPDVSLNASWDHDPYLLVTGGQVLFNGGTSAAAPTFAGILALLNQYLVTNKVFSSPGLGNINPMLYYLGANYPSVYHDITTGGNQVPCVPNSTQDCDQSALMGYKCGPGYDLATGWGSIDSAKLFSTWATVVNQTALLVITKFTLPAQVSVGGQVSLVLTVENDGNADAGAFESRVMFTTDGTEATAKSWGINCSVTSLAAGKAHTCTGTVTLDKSITAGTYTPLAVADYKQQIPQYDRTGNYAYVDGATITVK